MTQDEVRQLMQRTVQQVGFLLDQSDLSSNHRQMLNSVHVLQVAGTLSLDLDRAEHLLIHCKWNVDLLVQRYTDDPDTLIMAAGLKCRNPQESASPTSTCPVCLSPRPPTMEQVPVLSCMHYCCRVSARWSGCCGVCAHARGLTLCLCALQSCWQEYLTARIEQNLVMNCDCPITDCQAQPTSHFFHHILTDKDTIAKVTQHHHLLPLAPSLCVC